VLLWHDCRTRPVSRVATASANRRLPRRPPSRPLRTPRPQTPTPSLSTYAETTKRTPRTTPAAKVNLRQCHSCQEPIMLDHLRWVAQVALQPGSIGGINTTPKSLIGRLS